MELFTFIGLVIAILAGIIAITAFIGWVSNDDDNTLRWAITCLAYAVTVTIFIMNAM